MGLLHQPPDSEGLGQPLGYRPIGSFIDTRNRLVSGGERPVFNDTSRPGNEPLGSALVNWARRKPAETPEPKAPEDIQSGYDNLFQ